MDARQYQLACEYFEVLRDVGSAARVQKLSALEREKESTQDLVQQMLEADLLATKEGFLQDLIAPESTFALDAFASDGSTQKQTVGPYKVLGQLGAGGMGVVYKGYDPETDRLVALKVIRAHEFSTPEQVARFRREARAVAGLRHSNIVTVYGSGTDSGVDYIAMQYIDGDTLHAAARNRSIDELHVARIFQQLCEAVGYAHGRGIIHRDIKPGNVLLSKDGFPMLMDFGLAKSLFGEDGETKTGQILGTAGFMAPEQLTDAKSAGVACDIYALGATLYFCLTGRAPIDETNPVRLLREIQDRAPPPPSTFRPDVSRDLEEICLRCLQKEPGDRYESTVALKYDIQRFLSNEPLAAVPNSGWRSIARVVNKEEHLSGLPSAPAAGWLAILSFCLHLAIFIIVASNQAVPCLWAALAIWFIASNLVNYRYHWSRYWQLTPMERQSGLIQLGLNASLLFLFLMYGPLTADEPVEKITAVYPPYTLLLALALVAHGSIYAGRLLIAAACFFPLSLLFALYPYWAPLILCVAGTGLLIYMHLSFRRSDLQ